MENYKRRALELISNLTLEYKPHPAVIPYTPAKTKIMDHDRPSLKRSTPERHGIRSERIYELLSRLEEEERANVHSIMIIKDGAVISEASRPGFSSACPHLSHSMAKSVMGIVIGMLFDDGKIDTDARIEDFFPELSKDEMKFHTARVHHLLSMTSGISFCEVGSVTDAEWTRAALTCEPDFEPGEKFAYNSMNTYLLAVIAERILRRESGVSLSQYIENRLFSPLGIRNHLWERSAEGIIKGGWGLYLSCESWAKIGIMMGCCGIYEGRRILSEEWVKKSTSTHAEVPPEAGDFNYGYQIWIDRRSGDFLFNGMLGQNVWISPKDGIVVSLTSGNNELFAKSPALGIIKDCLANGDTPTAVQPEMSLRQRELHFFASRCWIAPRRERIGLPYALGIKKRKPFLDEFLPLIGKYDFPKNNHGIMPFFLRLMQNSYQGGIKSFTITKHADLLRLISSEGGVEHTLDFGFYSYIENVIEPSGERYIALCLADARENESGNIEYRLEILFPELPNTRRMLLYLSEDLILTLKMTEIPDSKIADSFIASIPAMSPKMKIAFELLERNLGKNFIKVKLTELFSPELSGVRCDSEIYEEHLRSEEEKRAKKIAASRFIRSLLYRFIRSDEQKDEKKRNTGPNINENQKEKPPGVGGALWSVISKIFS